MSAANQQRPNILLILTDDQGWDDMTVHGNHCVETPKLQRMADEAVQFDNFYVAPVCAPSRASLLTGRHFIRTGVSHVHGGRDFLHPDETLLSEVFKSGGYATGMWGKWHSGKTTGYLPWERGFDEAYMAKLYIHRDNFGKLNGEPQKHSGWTVDTLTDMAIDFMERHVDQPFFAFLPYLTVHAPLVSSDALIEKYMNKGLGKELATIYGMVEQLDDNIGRLMQTLDRLAIADNTIMIFLSDNGPQYFPQLSEHDLEVRYTSCFKGHKGSMWENGIKSPLFVRCPDRFAPRHVGRLADITDLMPTLMELCEIPMPDNHPGFDGRSILPCLLGNEDSVEPKESLIFSNLGWPPEKDDEDQKMARLHEYEPVAPDDKPHLKFDDQLMGLRNEKHKLLWRPGFASNAPEAVGGALLIDMIKDPRENHNAMIENTTVGLSMKERLQQWFEQIKSEPHSYHNPLFAVGPDTTNVVYAYAPVRLRGNVINGVLSSEDWCAVGDAAEYRIDVRQSGEYHIELELKNMHRPGVCYRLSAGDNTLEAAFGKEDKQQAGRLQLDAGEQILTFEIIDTPDNSSQDIFDKLIALRFELNS